MDRVSNPQRRFDPFALVTAQGTLEGTIDAFDLDRVQELFGEEDAEVPPADVHWRILGRRDRLAGTGTDVAVEADELRGPPVLDVELEGTLPLQCQRCLRVFDWPVQQCTTVLLARDQDELAALDDADEREVILAEGALDPLEIVEDELVLSLPYVPRCDRADCVAVDAARTDGGRTHGQDDAAADAPRTSSVFAALAALKRSKAPD